MIIRDRFPQGRPLELVPRGGRQGLAFLGPSRSGYKRGNRAQVIVDTLRIRKNDLVGTTGPLRRQRLRIGKLACRGRARYIALALPRQR